MEFGKVFRFFWQQSYGRLAKIPLCMFRRTFWGEIILFGKRTSFSSFPEFEQKLFRVLTTNFSRGGHKWILHVQKHKLRKNNFPSRKCIFSLFLFGIWVTNMWFFGEVFLVGLSKLHSALLENHFWWKQILIKRL